MGVNVVYAPVLDLASEPGEPGARDPLVRRRPGRGRAPRGGDGPRAAVGRRGRDGQALPGAGRRRPATRITALGVVHGRAADLEAHEFVPFRAAIAAGARLAMSAHVAVPALTGDATLPATLSRAVMAGLLRGELGFGGVTITDALDMGGARPGRGPGGRRRRRDPGRRRPAAAARRSGRLATDRGDARRGRVPAGCSTPTSWPPRARGSPTLRCLARGRGDAARTRRRRLAPAHRDLARARGAGADQLDPRPRRRACRRSPSPPARASSRSCPSPTDLTPADTSSIVAPGLGPRAARRGSTRTRRSSSPVAPSDAAIAGLRTRAAVADAVVVGTIEAHRQPRQVALVAALAATGTPTVAVALRAPWDAARTRPACRRSHVLDPAAIRSRRSRARSRARSAFPGRLPVAVPARPR